MLPSPPGRLACETRRWVGGVRANIRTPGMATRSDVHLLGLRSPCRAAGVRHSEFSFAQFRADFSPLRAKVNCECLTPAVLLKALRDLESGHLSPATPDRLSPLAQGLMASLTGNVRSSEHGNLIEPNALRARTIAGLRNSLWSVPLPLSASSASSAVSLSFVIWCDIRHRRIKAPTPDVEAGPGIPPPAARNAACVVT